MYDTISDREECCRELQYSFCTGAGQESFSARPRDRSETERMEHGSLKRLGNDEKKDKVSPDGLLASFYRLSGGYHIFYVFFGRIWADGSDGLRL